MNVLIIDYQMGNLGSVRRAFEECGASVTIASDPAELSAADRIILPGVGAFNDGMKNLESAGWVPTIKRAVKNPKVALLGICLGMQLLASKGHEGSERQGLDLIPGETLRLEPTSSETRIPHVGWNEVRQENEDSLFSGIANGTDFYFVHSYHFSPRNPAHALAWTPYCGRFVAAVRSGNIFGVQFHPEKSSRPGFQLLRNFLSL